MEQLELVRNSFNESIQIKIDSADALAEIISDAGAVLTQALVSNNKILTCGTNIEASLAQSFATLLLHQTERERPSLPAICLSDNISLYSAITEDTGANEVFSKQIRALGNSGDVLVTFSSDGNCFACAQAIRAALNKDLMIISLTGNDGGEIAGLTGPDDIEIRVPSANPQRVSEVQLMILNCLASQVDINLFGDH